MLEERRNLFGMTYQAAGMQTLVNSVRATGATNVITLGGVQYSGTLDHWSTYAPTDSAGQLAASFHTYNFTSCTTVSCWNSWLSGVGNAPLVTTEVGETDSVSTYIDAYTNWADAHGVSYLAWTWNLWGCGSGVGLITDFSGTPCQTYGSGYRAHLAALASVTSTTTAPPTTTTVKPTTTTVKATTTTTVPPTTTTTVTIPVTTTTMPVVTTTTTVPPTTTTTVPHHHRRHH